MPLSGSPTLMKTAHMSPSSTSQKYSNELKRTATSASAGAEVTSTTVPKSPPMTLNTKPAPRAVSASPFFVIAYASSVYAADAGVPGMRTRQPGMSPEKIAIAVAVTIEAIAGTGGMKKVTGTRSAVAMVAVSPGTAPTNSPNTADARMTAIVYGSNTSANAVRIASISPEDRFEHAPRERHTQQLVEQGVDHERRAERDDDRRQHAHPQLEEQRDEADGRGRDEPERAGGHDVEDEDRADREEVRDERRVAHPAGERDERAPRADAAPDEEHATPDEPDRDHAGEQRRAVLLPRDEWISLDVDEDRDRQRDQAGADDGVVDFHVVTAPWRPPAGG